MEQTFRPVLTIRIFGEEKCFGPGVAVLLRKVRELHSLRAAAMSIGMAYSKAWTILKNAQQSLGFSCSIPQPAENTEEVPVSRRRAKLCLTLTTATVQRSALTRRRCSTKPLTAFCRSDFFDWEVIF